RLRNGSSLSRPGALRWNDYHPVDAEAVVDHAEALGEEGLRERHRHLAAVTQGGEQPIGLRLVRGREGQAEALEIRLSPLAAVRAHDHRFTYAQARMHPLVFRAGRDHALLIRGAILEAREHLHFGAERTLVELDGLLAAAIEGEVGLDNHGGLLLGSRYSYD